MNHSNLVIITLLTGSLFYFMAENKNQADKIASLEQTVDFLVEKSNEEPPKYERPIERQIIKVASSKISEDDLYEISRNVYEYAREFNVQDKYIVALLAQESNFNRFAKSWAGAQGLGQIMPTTAKEIAEELGVETYDMYNPKDNIRFTAYYLNKMLKLFGNYSLAIAAYNAGPHRVVDVLNGRSVYPEETTNYHKKIMEYARLL